MSDAPRSPHLVRTQVPDRLVEPIGHGGEAVSEEAGVEVEG